MRRPRPLTGAVLAAFTVAAAIAGPAAFADPAATLYVSYSNGCSDTGGGTQAVPFCSPQAAADAALPGQTVLVAPSTRSVTYGPVTFTHSGSAGLPITMEADPAYSTAPAFATNDETRTPLTFRGTHDVTVRGLTVYRGLDGADVDGSQGITLDRLTFKETGDSATGSDLAVDGSSSGVTLSRSELPGDTLLHTGHDVTAAAGAHDVTVTTNYLHGTAESSVALDGVTNADVTSNTIDDGCGSEVALTGATTGAVENNVFLARSSTPSTNCPGAPLVSADATTAPGVTADYNDFSTADSAHRAAYSWAGTSYTLPGDRTTATGDGTHDTGIAAPGPYTTAPAAAVDAANADAPGELSTDFSGFAHADDPGFANTGTGAVSYADRGAFEDHDTITVPASETASPAQAAAPLTTSVPVGDATSAWHEPLTYTVDFGDGGAPVTATADAPATHTYTTPGAYTETVTATDSDGVTQTRTTKVVAATDDPAPATITAHTGQGVTGPVAGEGDFTFSRTDDFEMASQTVDFGDGTTGSAASTNAHQYDHPGSYPVTVTRTDVLGRVTTAKTTFTATDGYAAGWNPTVTATIAANGTWSVPSDSLGLYGDSPVELRVNATGATAGGWLTAYPAGGARPSASTLNFPAGHGASNQETVVPSSTGGVAIFNGAASPVKVTVQVVGTLGGNFQASSYHPTSPTTLVDTRYGTGGITGPVGAGKSITVPVAGTNGVPADATAVTLTVAENTTKSSGSLTVAPHGTTGKAVTASYWNTGESVTNLVTLPLTDGKVTLTNAGTGTANLIAALAGWYGGDTSGSGAWPVTPTRVLNTQTGLGETGGTAAMLPAGGTLKVKVAGTAGLPTTGLTAADLNLTVSAPTASGWLVAYPDGTTRPTAGAINYTKGHTIAGQAMIKVGDDGYVDLYNPTTTAINVFADIHGGWVPMS